MKIDELGCVVMEKDGNAGDLGDSCAETSRLMVIGDWDVVQKLNPCAFITSAGMVRHPNAPWREDDFTSDQALPLILGTQTCQRVSKDGSQSRFDYRVAHSCAVKFVESNWTTTPWMWKFWKVKLASPGVLMAAYEKWGLLYLSLILQWFIFKIPYRWSDAGNIKWYQRIQPSNNGAAADWLNYTVSAIFLKRLRGFYWDHELSFFNREVAMQKINEYYKTEPNSDWVVEQYRDWLMPVAATNLELVHA